MTPRTLTRRAIAAGATLLALSASTIAVAPATNATSATTATPVLAPATATDDPPGKLLLMLDASGSMKAKDPSGLTKIDAAKKALTNVITALPTGTPVGLRVYGARVDGGGKPTPAACKDTQLITPIAPVNKPTMTATINAIKALGETPIATSLTAALTDLGSTGKRNIVLVSDGEESCVPDPCPIIRKLTTNGINLQIDTVGFGVNTKARQQLQCIADAGNGTYYDAKNATTLTTSLTKLSQRALRPFTVDGTPVRATTDQAGAPTLTPGRYTDTYTVSPALRYYKLTRTPGSIVHLSLVVRPPSGGRSGTSTETWVVKLITPDGTECERANTFNLEASRGGAAMTVSASANNTNSGQRTPNPDLPCATSPVLIAQVEHDQGEGTNAAQIVYVEEPPVSTRDNLPDGLKPDQVTPLIAKPAITATPVTGGGSFGDAPEIKPGSYLDTLLPGEQLYYRVRLDFGQRAALTADINYDGKGPKLGPSNYQLYEVRAWTPALYDMSRSGGEPDRRAVMSSNTSSLSLTEYTPEIRYLNKGALGNGYNFLGLRQVSLPGYYYFAVLRAPESDPDLNGPVAVRINVAVEGTPQGQPTYANAPRPTTNTSTTDSAGPATQDTNSAAAPANTHNNSSPWATRALGVLVLLAATAGGLWAYRRRGSTARPPAH